MTLLLCRRLSVDGKPTQQTVQISVIRRHLRITLRRFRREPGFAALNLIGLSVGLATSFLILQFVQWELSYDEFHANADRIYRVIADVSPLGERAALQASVGNELAAGVPEVRQAVTAKWIPRTRVKVGEESSYEEYQFLYVGSGALEVFSWPLKAGNPSGALKEPFSVVLSESMANRYFEEERPVGRSIELDDRSYTVTGIMEDLSDNTHLQPEVLVSLRSLEEASPQDLGSFSYLTYVLLQEGAKPADVTPTFSKAAGGIWAKATFSLEPVTDIHLYAEHRYGPFSGGDPRYLYIFSAIAALILLLAAVNYTNLATARSARRAGEVGIRRAVGASRREVSIQFMSAAMVNAVVAGVLAVALSYVAMPFVAQLAGTAMGGSFSSWSDVGSMAAITLGIGLLSGLYPAIRLSRPTPASVMRSGSAHKQGGSGGLRKSLIVFQLAISVALIGSTFIIDRQLEYVQNETLGLHAEQILTVQVSEVSVRKNVEAIRNELQRRPAISSVTTSWGFPLKDFNRMSTPRTDVEDRRFGFMQFAVDDQFLSTLGIELLAGQPLEQASTDTSTIPVLVNEAFVRELDLEEPVGRTVPIMSEDEYQIAGVVEDFHLESARKEIGPLLLQPQSAIPTPLGGPNFVTMRFQPEQTEEVLQAVRETWAKVAPDYPFSHFFLDQAFAQEYRADRQIARLFAVFSAIAVLIACLGILGLAGYMAQRRSKEISIRKVLGATLSSVVSLISWEFLKLALFSLVIGLPGAYVAIQWWLQDFAYQVSLGPLVFVNAAVLGVVLVLVAASYHAVRAGLTNPADTLRYE